MASITHALEFPALVALQASHEGRHGLIRRAGLELIVVTRRLLLATATEQSNAGGLGGGHRLHFASQCLLHGFLPTNGLQIHFVHHGEGLHIVILQTIQMALQMDATALLHSLEHEVVPRGGHVPQT